MAYHGCFRASHRDQPLPSLPSGASLGAMLNTGTAGLLPKGFDLLEDAPATTMLPAAQGPGHWPVSESETSFPLLGISHLFLCKY